MIFNILAIKTTIVVSNPFINIFFTRISPGDTEKPETPNKPNNSGDIEKPETSDKPSNPEESDELNKPNEQDNNIQNGANINQILGGERLPKTGDVGVIHYSIFSMLAISALFGINKKRKNKR